MPLVWDEIEADPRLVEVGIHCDKSGWRMDYDAVSVELKKLMQAGEEDKFLQLMRVCAQDDFLFLCYFVLDMPVSHPFLVARCYDIQDKHGNTVNLYAREHWKALAFDTPILTTSGWKKHGELKVGDSVYGSDGNPVKITARTENFKNSKQYEITFNSKHKIIASCDHIWEVYKRTNIRKKGKKRESKVKVLMTTDEIFDHGCIQDNRLSIEAQPVQFKAKDYPINPYVLGAWLGDGTSSSGAVTNEDKDVWDKIEHSGYAISNGIKNKKITKTIYKLKPLLNKLGVINNKHIPPLYKYGSLDQRLDLLRGLMDTDGTIDDRNRCTFCNINKKLSEDFYEVAVSLGMNPTFSTFINKKLKNNNYVFYNVSFVGRKDKNPFYLKRKADKIYIGDKKQYKFITDIKPLKDGENLTNCIQVDAPDGIYLCGKELIKTHNSSLLTFGLTIWKLIHNKNERIGIFSHTRAMAISHLRRIKQELETNLYLLNAFPDIFHLHPKADAPKWAEYEGLYTKRTKSYGEASVEAWGLIEGLPVGKHFSVLIYDDVIETKSVSTADQIMKATHQFKLSLNLGARGGEKWIVGTRYSFKDTYAEIMLNKFWKPVIHPAEVELLFEPGSEELEKAKVDKLPLFKAKRGGIPVYLSTDELDKKFEDMGEFIYGSQMLQDPTVAGTQKFYEHWLRFWSKHRPYMNIYITVDPANSKKRDSDYTVMAVIGVDSLRNYWLIDMVRDRLELRERWEKLRDLVKTWQVDLVGYETYGAQADSEYMRQMMEEEGVFFDLMELGGKVSKYDRIKGLIPLFQKGRFIIPRTLVYTDLKGEIHDLTYDFMNEEYILWPYSKHDDALDAIARITDAKMGVVFPTRATVLSDENVEDDPLDLHTDNNIRGSWMSQ